VRAKAVDTVCDLANAVMARGRPWHALQVQAFGMAQAQVRERERGSGPGPGFGGRVGNGHGNGRRGSGSGSGSEEGEGGREGGDVDADAGRAAGMREAAYRVFAGCPNLVMDLQVEAVVAVFQRGLADAESVQVCLGLLDSTTECVSDMSYCMVHRSDTPPSVPPSPT
jgi:importin-5